MLTFIKILALFDCTTEKCRILMSLEKSLLSNRGGTWWSWTWVWLALILAIPLSAQFCLDRWMGIWQEAGQDGGTLKSKSTQPRTTTTRAGSACKILEVLSHQRKNFSRAPMTNLLVVSMAQLGTTDARLYSSWAPTAIDARLV